MQLYPEKVLNGVFEENENPMGFYSLNNNRIKIPREIFPVGETKYAVLDSNVIISCSVDKEVSNNIQKKYLNDVFEETENPMGFFSLEK